MIKPLRLGLLLILLAVTSYYAVLHWRVLQIGHPITQDEPGFVELTAAGNPYTLEGVTTCANVYGPGYAFWARPFTAVIANPYIAHRWASSCALFAMLGLLAWVLRREGVGGIETAAGLAIVYILNVSSHSLAASADLLGAALFIAALAVSRRGTWPALLGGIVLAFMGALTKPYFALGWGIIASHLLLFGSPRRALAYLGLSGLLAGLLAGVLHAFAPYYFLSAVVVHRTVLEQNLAFLLDQSLAFALLAGGVLILALMDWPRRRTVTLSFRQPWLSPGLDLWNWAALLAAVALLGWLGGHPGNFLVYYYHLLLGPLVIVALRRIPAWPRFGRALLGANLFVLGWLLPPQPGQDNWAALQASVAAVRGPILSDPLLEPFSHSRPNLTLLTHGQTVGIRQALAHFGPQVPAAYAGIQRELLRTSAELDARIRAREFAAIYLTYVEVGPYSAWIYGQNQILQALFASYRPEGGIIFYPYAAPYWDRLHHGQSPHHVIKWVPKPSAVNNSTGHP